MYLAVFATSVGILCFNTKYNAEIAAFDVASAMGNVGLGLMDYTPVPNTFLDFLPFWVLALDMILGRLEIMPLAYAVVNIKEESSYLVQLRRKGKQSLLP